MPRHRSIDVDDPLEFNETPLSSYEVAQLFGVRHETIYRWVREGKLVCARNPWTNFREFDPDHIRHMLGVLRPYQRQRSGRRDKLGRLVAGDKEPSLG